MEQIKTGLPGLSQQVPPRLTAFGEEARRESPAWSPISITPEKQSAIDTELGRLDVDVGFVGKSIAGLALSRERQQEYQQNAGQIVKLALNELFTSNSYQALNDLEKEKAIERTVANIRDKVREALLKRWAFEEQRVGVGVR